MKTLTIKASADGLDLAVAVCAPETQAKGLVQIVHGMAEHKERYYEFMEFLASNGYVAVVSDLRGHGESVKSEDDLGYLYDGGWLAMVEDIKVIHDWARQEYPNLPVTLFGHSMGSLIARSFAKRYDDSIQRLLLCGSPSDNPMKGAGLVLAGLIGAIRGSRHRSKILNNLTFGSFNKSFKAAGPFAWLSKDAENVRGYIQDPYCGFCFTVNGFQGLLRLMRDCYGPAGWKMAHPQLSILFLSGGNDPCRVSDKDFGKAVDFLKARGYTQVRSKLYPTLRHEILHEENPEVFTDILKFIA